MDNINNYSVGFNMSNDDIVEAINMDKESFSNSYDLGVFSNCVSWQYKNNQIYITVKFRDELIGYLCFMPLKNSTYKKYKLGLLHDSDLTGHDIVAYKPNHKYNCLFCSIIIKQEFRRNFIVVKLLLKALKQRLLNLQSKNIEIKNVLADCVTPDGIKLAKRMGFTYVSDHAQSKIYELNKSLLEVL